MGTEHLVPVQQFCTHHNIEFSFINSLHEFGLIEVTTIEETHYLSKEQLRDVEKMVRLHYELEINIEGIDAISHLLQRVDGLHEQVTSLKNRLRAYENE